MTTKSATESGDGPRPHLRKAGRYLFFGFCAFGISLEIYGAGLGLGIPKEIAHMAANAGLFIAFLALRDMSKVPPNE